MILNPSSEPGPPDGHVARSVDADIFAAFYDIVDAVHGENTTIVLLQDGEICWRLSKVSGEWPISFSGGSMALNATIPVLKLAEADGARIERGETNY